MKVKYQRETTTSNIKHFQYQLLHISYYLDNVYSSIVVK